MRFQGSNLIVHEGKTYVRIRNKPRAFVEMSEILLAFCKFDPRYFELYLDKAGNLWVRRPAGKQVLAPEPYKVVLDFPSAPA